MYWSLDEIIKNILDDENVSKEFKEALEGANNEEV